MTNQLTNRKDIKDFISQLYQLTELYAALIDTRGNFIAESHVPQNCQDCQNAIDSHYGCIDSFLKPPKYNPQKDKNIAFRCSSNSRFLISPVYRNDLHIADFVIGNFYLQREAEITENNIQIQENREQKEYEIPVITKQALLKTVNFAKSRIHFILQNADSSTVIGKEQQNKEKVNYLTTIFDHLNHIVYIVDIDNYEILYANAHTMKVFGEKIIGEKCYAVFQHSNTICDNCPDSKKKNKAPYFWEYYNENYKLQCQVINREIRWWNNKKARLEIAIDISKQKNYEKQINSRLRYEKQLALISQKLLKSKTLAISEILEHLLAASQVCRVYIFENFRDENNRLCMKQTYEKTLPSVKSEIDNPELQHIDYERDGFSRWHDNLKRGIPVKGLISNFPEDEQKILAPQGILSLLTIPIFVNHTWFGFIGFDDTKNFRIWNEEDIRLLQTAAEMIGSHIERIQTQDIIIESENRFRALFESAPDAIFLADSRSGIIIDANFAASRLLKKPTEQIIGMHQSDLHPKYVKNFSKSIFNKHIEDSMDYGYSDSSELEVITADNEIIPVEISSQTIYIEGKPYLQGIFRDISERKTAEKAIKENNEKYRLIMNYTSDMICEVDSKGNYTFLNSQYNRILKTDSTKSLIGTSSFERIHHEDIDRVKSSFFKAMKAVCEVIVSYRYFTGDNDWIWFESKANFYKNRYGEVNAVVVSRDISKTRQIQRNLKHAKEKSEEANRAKSEFLANVSHEIRTPMNAILGFSEILKEKLADCPKYHEYLNGIITGGKNLLSLINDILDLSKIEAGKFAIKKEHTNIFQLIDEIRQIFSIKTTEKKLDFVVSIDEKLPQVLLLDETRLRQVLFNLVGNAVKFTAEGKISIIVKGDKKNTAENNLDIIFQIKDTGIGIPEEHLEDIFLPFHQRDSQSSRKYEGTGLGLAISRRLAKMMNGEITVESKPGVGSCFTVKLCNVLISQQNNQTSSDEKIELQFDIEFDDPIILIVEDVVSNRDVIKGFFEGFNINFVEAKDGEEALRMTGKFFPDLILMDLQMPVLDGYAATKRIKTNSNRKINEIPVVALTATVLSSTNSKKLAFFDDILKKPVTKSELIDVLKKYLPYKKKTRTIISKDDSFLELLHQELNQQNNILPEDFFVFIETVLLPMHEIARKTLSIEKIKFFAKKVIETGNQYKIETFSQFGEALNMEAQQFKFQSIIKSLSLFSVIIKIVLDKRM